MTQPTPAFEIDPHEHDEDPEACIGAPVKDPWEDDEQTDWPNEEVAV